MSGSADDEYAGLLVRIMESYVYISLFTGDKPDAERASNVIRALLPVRR